MRGKVAGGGVFKKSQISVKPLISARLRKGEILIMGNGVPDNYDWGRKSQLCI